MTSRINRSWVRRTHTALKSRPCPVCRQTGDPEPIDSTGLDRLGHDDRVRVLGILLKLAPGYCEGCGRAKEPDLSALSLDDLRRLEAVLSGEG